MTKIVIVAVTLMALAFPAKAEEPLLCWGRSIRDVSRDFARSPAIIGTGPIKVWRRTCGGGYDPLGEIIPKWECFIQLWKAKIKSETRYFLLSYDRDAGEWQLTNAELCSSPNDCEHISGIEQCKKETKDSRLSKF